jgi:hypothetical protein
MAFTPNSFLYRPSNVTLRDQQHAARVFTDDQFRLAPKHKFLFHVAFNINPAALRDINIVQRHRNEINVMVKDTDLPNYTVAVETLNQYNRKKNVQTTHKYNAISMTFHDDNMGLVNQLWQNYYSYYYADPSSSGNPGAYKRTAMKNSNYVNNPYGLDNGSTTPFFNYITIYQMARHEFVSYTLINPIISSWNHNKVSYSQTGTHDNTISIQYEAVNYGSGLVTPGDPEGFGLEHYDQTPSSLIGSVDATPDSPSFAGQPGPTGNASTLNTLVEQTNTYLNTREKENVNTSTNVLSMVTSSPAPAPLNGQQGLQFPTATNKTTPNTSSVATQKILVNPTGVNNSSNVLAAQQNVVTDPVTTFNNGPQGEAGLQLLLNDIKNAKTPADAAAIKAKANASIAAGQAALEAAGYTKYTYNGYTGYY